MIKLSIKLLSLPSSQQCNLCISRSVCKWGLQPDLTSTGALRFTGSTPSPGAPSSMAEEPATQTRHQPMDEHQVEQRTQHD